MSLPKGLRHEQTCDICQHRVILTTTCYPGILTHALRLDGARLAELASEDALRAGGQNKEEEHKRGEASRDSRKGNAQGQEKRG